MGSMPLAFSVHNFISSVGADAGFAAIIGLAVLVLLYFAHARETANLREEAALLAERLQQAEARVAELSRPASAGVSVPTAEGVSVPAAAGVQVTDRRGADVAVPPFAPAGVGAPALAAATRVVPLVDPAPAEPVSQPAVAVAAASGAAAYAPPPVAPPPPSVAPRPAPTPEPVGAGAVSRGPAAGFPAPATSAGAGSAGGNGGGRGGPPAMPASPARAPAPGGAPFRDLPPLGAPARSRSRIASRIVVGLAALAFVAAVVVALLILTSGTTSSGPRAPATRTSNAPIPRRTAAFIPSAVTVAVLNGTATNQLAHRVAAKLATSGYKEGRIATAANQTQTTTVVAYLPGSKNHNDALHVATALKLKPTAVRPIDQSTQQVACPGACAANVVVTVGADLATL